MKIEESNVKKLKITDYPNLDPVAVFIEDIEPGKGKVTIECFGESWSSYWGAMGGNTVAEFFCICDDGYLANCLSPRIIETENDYEAFGSLVKGLIIARRRGGMISADFARNAYDIEDWEEYAPKWDFDCWLCPLELDQGEFDCLSIGDIGDIDIPTKESNQYKYLTRIIAAVKAGLQHKEEG